MTVSRADYYKTLELKKDATQAQIRKAYLDLMRKHHPDKSTENGDKAAKLSEAYKALYSPPKQKQGEDYKTNVVSSKESKHEAEPGFELSRFMDEFHLSVIEKKPEELETYFLDNVENLQATITSVYFVEQLVRSFPERTYALLIHLDSAWLRSLEDFCVSFMGRLLNRIPVEHWSLFLDHIGSEWFKSFVGHPSSLKTFTGCLTRISSEDSSSEKKIGTLFEYLGQENLRKFFDVYALGFFFIDNSRGPFLLDFLNGQDKWLQQRIADGKTLGILLEKMVITVSPACYFGGRFFKDNVDDSCLTEWNQLLKYLHPDWQKNIVDNFVELNAILREFSTLSTGYFRKSPKIALFLSKFLNQNVFSDLNDLLTVLAAPNGETGGRDSLNIMQSLQFVEAFDKQHLARIVFNNKKFEEVLQTIDQYKDKPCYRALLYATTAAYRYVREQNDAPFITSWEQMWGITREKQLTAANELMKAILQDQEVPKVSGIGMGQLGQLSSRYSTNRNPYENECHETARIEGPPVLRLK